MTSVSAPAKINLCLRVGERREDGYHRVGHGPGWVWYLSDDAGPRALAAARSANKAAMGR